MTDRSELIARLDAEGDWKAAAALREQAGEIERAYNMLSMHGVPQERARSVANGIAVLVTRMDKERDTLARENAGLRKDAERYRWLREDNGHASVEIEDRNEDGWADTFYAAWGDALDAAIDVAMEPKETQNGSRGLPT